MKFIALLITSFIALWPSCQARIPEVDRAEELFNEGKYYECISYCTGFLYADEREFPIYEYIHFLEFRCRAYGELNAIDESYMDHILISHLLEQYAECREEYMKYYAQK